MKWNLNKKDSLRCYYILKILVSTDWDLHRVITPKSLFLPEIKEFVDQWWRWWWGGGEVVKWWVGSSLRSLSDIRKPRVSWPAQLWLAAPAVRSFSLDWDNTETTTLTQRTENRSAAGGGEISNSFHLSVSLQQGYFIVLQLWTTEIFPLT